MAPVDIENVSSAPLAPSASRPGKKGITAGVLVAGVVAAGMHLYNDKSDKAGTAFERQEEALSTNSVDGKPGRHLSRKMAYTTEQEGFGCRTKDAYQFNTLTQQCNAVFCPVHAKQQKSGRCEPGLQPLKCKTGPQCSECKECEPYDTKCMKRRIKCERKSDRRCEVITICADTGCLPNALDGHSGKCRRDFFKKYNDDQVPGNCRYHDSNASSDDSTSSDDPGLCQKCTCENGKASVGAECPYRSAVSQQCVSCKKAGLVGPKCRKACSSAQHCASCKKAGLVGPKCRNEKKVCEVEITDGNKKKCRNWLYRMRDYTLLLEPAERKHHTVHVEVPSIALLNLQLDNPTEAWLNDAHLTVRCWAKETNGWHEPGSDTKELNHIGFEVGKIPLEGSARRKSAFMFAQLPSFGEECAQTQTGPDIPADTEKLCKEEGNWEDFWTNDTTGFPAIRKICKKRLVDIKDLSDGSDTEFEELMNAVFHDDTRLHKEQGEGVPFRGMVCKAQRDHIFLPQSATAIEGSGKLTLKLGGQISLEDYDSKRMELLEEGLEVKTTSGLVDTGAYGFGGFMAAMDVQRFVARVMDSGKRDPKCASKEYREKHGKKCKVRKFENMFRAECPPEMKYNPNNSQCECKNGNKIQNSHEGVKTERSKLTTSWTKRANVYAATCEAVTTTKDEAMESTTTKDEGAPCSKQTVKVTGFRCKKRFIWRDTCPDVYITVTNIYGDRTYVNTEKQVEDNVNDNEKTWHVGSLRKVKDEDLVVKVWDQDVGKDDLLAEVRNIKINGVPEKIRIKDHKYIKKRATVEIRCDETAKPKE